MDQIQFTAEDLYDKDKVDIEHGELNVAIRFQRNSLLRLFSPPHSVSMEDVLTLLQCDEGGLTDEEAARRIGIFGPNKVSFQRCKRCWR